MSVREYSISADSAQYVKTIIAFANTQVGCLVVGVDDTRNVAGVDDDSAFQIMDSIANAVAVTSSGGLYNGLTCEEIMSGHAKFRDRTIANIFNQMGPVEA